jgi:hypothetical protein
MVPCLSRRQSVLSRTWTPKIFLLTNARTRYVNHLCSFCWLGYKRRVWQERGMQSKHLTSSPYRRERVNHHFCAITCLACVTRRAENICSLSMTTNSWSVVKSFPGSSLAPNIGTQRSRFSHEKGCLRRVRVFGSHN